MNISQLRSFLVNDFAKEGWGGSAVLPREGLRKGNRKEEEKVKGVISKHVGSLLLVTLFSQLV